MTAEKPPSATPRNPFALGKGYYWDYTGEFPSHRSPAPSRSFYRINTVRGGDPGPGYRSGVMEGGNGRVRKFYYGP